MNTLKAPQYRRIAQHSKLVNDLLKTAMATTLKDRAARQKTIALFDIPALARACMETLRAQGVGLVQVQSIQAVPGQPVLFEIRYFSGLDDVTSAQLCGSMRTSSQSYDDYSLAVGDIAVIRWRKPVH